MKGYCPHCWPSKTTSHLNNHLEYYQEKIARFLPRREKQSFFWSKLLETLSLLKFVEFVENPEKKHLYNRSLIFFEEAKKRGLKIEAVKVFGKYDNTFRYVLNGNAAYYDNTPLHVIGQPIIDLDNKFEIKKILQKHGLPIADGGLFTDTKKALEFAKSFSFPVIVKPNTGSLSHHVSGRIDNPRAMLQAIKIVQQYRPDFIVERFIEGKLFRATVIGQKYVFICHKDPANVIGNGRSSIRHLIAKKNQLHLRGVKGRRDSTLHKIAIDKTLRETLHLRGLNPASVLPKNKKIYLHQKVVLSAGCDVIACTDLAHPDNKKMFLQTAKSLNTPVVGIDFIAQSIKKSYKKQKTVIIETNSLPYIDMHQFPSSGKPDPVAKLVWDYILHSHSGNPDVTSGASRIPTSPRLRRAG